MSVVRFSGGAVRGLSRPGSTAFLGIPFAQAPVGERRFLPPVRHAAWDGERPATGYGPTPQRRPFAEISTIPEPSIPGAGTLNVNVFTPVPGDREALLPVLVWIHGGGFFAGSPASPWYDGRSFNRDGVVTVTLSYRLGFDGFGWMDGGGLNRALLDQISALEWVQENIRDFGGDPDAVTIAGQSAGASCALALLAAPTTAGLFRGVIAHSPVITAQSAGETVAASVKLAASLGIAPTLEGWRSLTEDQVLDVERFGDEGAPVPAAEMVHRLRAGQGPTAGFGWSPAIGDSLLPVTTLEVFASGTGADVPLVVGSTRNEIVFPSPQSAGDLASELAAADVPASAVGEWRHEVERIGAEHAASQWYSSALFRSTVVRTASARAGSSRSGTWMFEFAGRSALDGTSQHCTDIPFAFDLLDAEGVERVLGEKPSQGLADTLHADWVGFVKTGQMPWTPAEPDTLGRARRYENEGSFEAEQAYLFEVGLAGTERHEH